ncbi:MAG: ATP cone domain-containing protein [Kiritimatiellae bacterium]|jgi:uridine kinase|nr:ATP cone domain-containing protein [Kiritimatiellia bacterium]
MITNIVKRDGAVVKYDRERIESAVFRAAVSNKIAAPKDFSINVSEKVEELLNDNYTQNDFPTVEDIQDIVEQVLMKMGQGVVAKDYILYRNQRAMERSARASDFQVTDMVPYKKIYEVLWWNMANKCTNIGELNKIIEAGRFESFSILCEKRYEDEVLQASLKILDRIADLKLIIVAGPSSSGKTTTARNLQGFLKSVGVKVKTINVDNYFFDKETHPCDEFGDFDYERPQALDLALISNHLNELIKGNKIFMPFYDFVTGKRTLNATEFSIDDDELILIDSLHGLYDEMTKSIPNYKKFKVYIECLGQFQDMENIFLRWSDNRLLRRMSRDRLSRNMSIEGTLTHWHYVRKSELQDIIPYIHEADAIINTALPYEFAFWKKYLFDELAELKSSYIDDPKRLDAHIRVNRVYKFLEKIAPIDDVLIPKDALICEFMGS